MTTQIIPDGLDPKHVWDALFWADLENDAALKDCSPGAQGFWVTRMLPICARAKRRGYFLHNGKVPTLDQLVKWSGYPAADIPGYIEELGRKGVYSVDAEGVIYNRRIVRQELKKAAGGAPTPTEKQLADKAIGAMLTQEAKEAARKASQRERTNRSRRLKKEAAARAQMEAFDAMSAAVAASDARLSAADVVTPSERDTPRDCHVTHPLCNGVTPVTLHVFDHEVRPVTAPLDIQTQYPYQDKHQFEPSSPARSPAPLTGSERAERDEGQGSPGAMQARIADRMRDRPPIQAPNESDEAFAARCAAKLASAA